MQTIEDRLATLERRLRRMQFLALGSFAALVLVVGVAATRQAEDLQVANLTAETISVGSLTLRDEQGRPRIAMRIGTDGGPFISLLDEETKVRLLLTLHEKEHPLVQLSDANEAPQINLFHNQNLGAGLIQLGTAGRALYAVPTGGQPIVELYDGDGEKIFTAP